MHKGIMLIISSALVIFSISTISFSQVQPEVESTFRGDINEDGQVNIFDFLELLKVLGNTSEKTDRTLQIADVDANGGVNIFDLLGLLKVLAGNEQLDVIYWGPAIIGLNRPSAALGDTIDIAVANIEETVSADDVKAYIGECEIGILDFSLKNVRIVIPEGFNGGNLWLMIGSDTTNAVLCNYKVRQYIQASVGGNVKHPIGASVSIPIGALQEDISISINEITRETIKSLGILEDTCEVLVELGPTGSVFSLPVTVGLPWPTNVYAQDSLEGVYFNTEEGNWASLPKVQRDNVNRILYVRMEHFTIVKSRKKTYSLQGFILKSGIGLEGVNVSVIGDRVDTTLTTGKTGVYRLDDLKDGIYMIIPTKIGYTFNPANVQVYINQADASVVDIGAWKIFDTPLLNDPGSIVCSCISYILNWSKAIGATTYTIEEADNNNFTISTRYIITDTLFNFIKNVSTTTTYYYRVKANSATDSSNWSNIVDIVISKLAVEHILETLVSIPAGSFQMGSLSIEIDEGPVHTVTLGAFQMSATEITTSQYAAFLNEAIKTGEIRANKDSVIGAAGYYPGYEYLSLSESDLLKNKCRIIFDGSSFSVEPSYEHKPVTFVTWYGAAAFAAHYRISLPTEAEWEYACRGGRQLEFGTDDGTISLEKANYDKHIASPTDVGSYPANPFGLLDMAGNISEWCNDWYDLKYYNNSPSENPLGPVVGTFRVGRGGGWHNCDSALRSANRTYYDPHYRMSYLGFRVVKR